MYNKDEWREQMRQQFVPSVVLVPYLWQLDYQSKMFKKLE